MLRMDHQRIPQQELHWEVPDYKRDRTRPAKDKLARRSVRRMGLTWEEEEAASVYRQE